MLIRTHLVITIFFILIFLSSVNNKLVFVLTALFATFLPDIDTRYSKLGKRKLARILQFFTKHRGIIHSFTFLIGCTFLLVLFFPIISLGFFLGYGLHLLADSFTRDGIRPFYPLKKGIRGSLRTGGSIEIGVLIGFLIADVLLIFGFIF